MKAGRYVRYQEEFESSWQDAIAGTSFVNAPAQIREPVLYSLDAPGKRLRPVLFLAACESLPVEEKFRMPVALALECIHTYSLIHDDLPAMDDDDLRRGRPTVHKVYGEAAAILAGDSLNTLAFELLALAGVPHMAIAAVACAAGGAGMAGGQAMDMSRSPELQRIHQRKTAAMIRVSVGLPSLILNRPDENRWLLWGAGLGRLFQITDDILDYSASSEALGKTSGKDARQQKTTYVSRYGIDRARDIASGLAGRLQKLMTILAPENETLILMADAVLRRGT